MGDHASRVALVTGAGQSIGRQIALTLARKGVDIVAADVNSETAGRTAEEASSTGVRSLGLCVDVADSLAVGKAVESAVAEMGSLDILVNNAGITRDGLLLRMSIEDWEKVLDVNLKGAFNCCKAACRPMMKARWGRIVNISSVIGVMGNAGQVNYAASKAGLIGLTKSLAKELAGRGITVNAVAPGFIDTPMTESLGEKVKSELLGRIPLGRLGDPTDVADVVSFLASEGARYMTGQVIHVDGGMVM
jgi:3-oxoacyl-[acyl-carrier protein] reductase